MASIWLSFDSFSFSFGSRLAEKLRKWGVCLVSADGCVSPPRRAGKGRSSPGSKSSLMAHVARRMAHRLAALAEGDGNDYLDPELAALCEAIFWSRNAPPGTRDIPLLPEMEDPSAEERGLQRKPLCAALAGLSLHAAQFVPADDREALERLCRYGLRARGSRRWPTRGSGSGRMPARRCQRPAQHSGPGAFRRLARQRNRKRRHRPLPCRLPPRQTAHAGVPRGHSSSAGSFTWMPWPVPAAPVPRGPCSWWCSRFSPIPRS